MAGKGGARPGAGRPPNRIKFESEIARADKRIAKNLVRYIADLEQLADGVMVQEMNPITQKLVVYQKPPDRAANEYLINRIMGKPTEHVEATGKDGGPIETVGMSLDEWRQRAAEQRANAEDTLGAWEQQP